MSWSTPLIRILTLRCREAAVLSSKELDEPLSLSERIAVRGHRLICRSCRRFAGQIRFLHEALRERPANRSVPSPADDALSDQARQRIERVMARQDVDDMPSD